MGNPVEINGLGDVLDFTPVLDTSQYADGDVLFITQILPKAVRFNTEIITGNDQRKGCRAWLTGVTVLDEDDQGAAFDLLFLDTNVSIGTINQAVSITDANARKILGRLPIGSGDYYDLGGCRFADVAPPLPMLLKAAPPVGQANRDLWVAGVSRGTGTYTASGMKLKFRLAWD